MTSGSASACAPWPDFLTFYGTTATGAGFVLPKRYLERVGQDGFKHHPIGLERTRVCAVYPRGGGGTGSL